MNRIIPSTLVHIGYHTLVCLVFMHIYHAHLSCTFIMHIYHTHLSCTFIMHTYLAHLPCTFIMHICDIIQFCDVLSWYHTLSLWNVLISCTFIVIFHDIIKPYNNTGPIVESLSYTQTPKRPKHIYVNLPLVRSNFEFESMLRNR